jgi:hypothetical protein
MVCDMTCDSGNRERQDEFPDPKSIIEEMMIDEVRMASEHSG